MRTPKKSLSETAYGMWICYGENGDLDGDCAKCPYYNGFDNGACFKTLRADAVYYLECFTRIADFVKEPMIARIAPTFAEEKKMEEKYNAENHVL